MKSKILVYIVLILTIVNILCVNVSAKSDYTVGNVEEFIDSIVAWKQESTNEKSVEGLINNSLAKFAGTGQTEWYVIALKQYKGNYSYNGYLSALDSYVGSMTNQKATDVQRIAIAYAAVGNNSSFINNTLNNTIGKLGIMSYIYGLMLLDSGAYNNDNFTRNDIINNIFSLQLSDGGWALTGSVSDPDITAMSIQALAPYYKFNDVKSAVDKALSYLSKIQLKDGDYSSWGTRNAETVAQVICALCSLNIDPQKDTRFIKNGNSLIDGLLLYRLQNGSFSHTLGGLTNNNASVQALYSFVSVWRQANNLGTLCKFSDKVIERILPSTTTPQPGATIEPTNIEPGSSNNSTAKTPDKTSELATDNVPVNKTPGTTVNLKTTPDIDKENTKINYKPVIYIIITVVALILISAQFISKRRNTKNIISIIVLALIMSSIVFFINIQSVDEYYQVHIDDIKPDSKTVFISIRCDTAVGKLKKDYIPPDGTILNKTEYVLREGDTVFDLLERTTKHHKMQFEYSGSAKSNLGTVYVKGINYLYELDLGDLSGWMFKVNGKFPSEGCSEYILSDGDVIEWVYSCDLGKDVGNN